MKKGPGVLGGVIFALVLLGGLAYCGFNIVNDVGHVAVISAWPSPWKPQAVWVIGSSRRPAPPRPCR